MLASALTSQPEMRDSHEPHSSRLRTRVLLCLAAALAFAVTLVFVRSPTKTVSSDVRAASTSVAAVVEVGVRAPPVTQERQELPPNPAEQKPGPPDPGAQSTAAAAAERAARVAADVAATQ